MRKIWCFCCQSICLLNFNMFFVLEWCDLRSKVYVKIKCYRSALFRFGLIRRYWSWFWINIQYKTLLNQCEQNKLLVFYIIFFMKIHRLFAEKVNPFYIYWKCETYFNLINALSCFTDNIYRAIFICYGHGAFSFYTLKTYFSSDKIFLHTNK